MEREKAVTRAAKLQAQMESEQALGNSEAAEAFAGMMQRLMLEHELHEQELAAARMAGSQVPEEPIVEHRVNLFRAGIPEKAARSANLERLAHIVGQAHLCKILIRPRSNQIWFVGTAKHAEVAEYMLATLNRALTKIAKDAYERYYHEVGGNTTKGYIAAFKRAFLQHLAVRYDDEQRQVVKEHDAAAQAAGGACTALVRLNGAMTRVERYIEDKMRGRRPAPAVGGSHHAHTRGANDGLAAANGIALRANAVKSGSTPKALIG